MNTRSRHARHFTIVATVVAVAAPLFAQAPPAAPADRWPQFRGSLPLAGTSGAALPQTLKVLWTYEAGDAIESSAAIADGVVYVGSQTGELHAVSLADGTPKWRYKASEDGIGESSPAIAGGLVLIGDLSGTLHAVQAATGKPAWTFKTGGEVKSSPVVAGETVLIGSYDAHLYALSLKDGTLRWKVRTNGYVHATPAVVDGVAYIAGCDEILRAIRITDGKELFELSSGAYTGASPVVTNGFAYYGTYENEVLGVDLKAKKIAWTYKHPERNFPFYSSAALAGDRLIVGGRDKMVHAIDRKTGLLGHAFHRRVLQKCAQGLAVRLILADALLNGLVECRLFDDVGLLGPRAGRCHEHDRERGRKDSTNYLHELLPPRRHDSVPLSRAGEKHLPCPNEAEL